jgi:hypothetical protein
MGRLYLPSTASSPERMAQGEWMQAGRHELTLDISSLDRMVNLTYLIWFLPEV